MKPKIRQAEAGDLPAVVALLSACGLPSSDLTTESLLAFYVAEADGRMVGIGGLEIVDVFALLRSVVVAPDFRSRGLARELIETCEALARTKDIQALYLIANDAAAVKVFDHFGYTSVVRAQVPPVLRSLPEFSHLCPQSYPCLCKIINPHFNEASFMKKLEIFDPAMCCSTGVCGVEVDPVLVQFAADLQWVSEQGVDVKRYNLAQEPQAFAANAAVIKEMQAGLDRLPIIVVDSQIVATGVHLSRTQLAQKLGLKVTSENTPRIKVGGTCCNPKSGCC